MIVDDARIVITVARFTAQKGHETFLHAAVEVSRQLPNVVFLLVGDGLEREAMVELAASLDLANVSFLGERVDVPDLLALRICWCCRRSSKVCPLSCWRPWRLASGRCNARGRHC